MDRLAGGLDGREEMAETSSAPAIAFSQTAEDLLVQSQARLQVPDALFRLDQLDVLYDDDAQALWTYMRPVGRPSFTPQMLGDFVTWQDLIGSHFGPGRAPLRYLVLGSRAPGVFCFGGDLELFATLIREGNRDGLAAYGYRCVEILSRNLHSLDLPILTIGLVQGQALGGGFEALLSFDYIVAERGATFGLPEVKFGLFPGMGAHAFLTRKLGSALADRVIMDDQTFTAEELYERGIVHVLAEPGQGEAAVRAFMAKAERRHAGLVGARRASKRSENVTLHELRDIVDYWADSAIKLREQDLKLMQRLAAAQVRIRPQVSAAA
ncbi:DSF synthase [Novosphingobium kunmingense]|uniref:DSF synthase n=1 Tax=Novosphingobium kunmingense TaxID=1211806 RepID=A0A2N0I347_9SPHN|nr:crotonase/enoyl-CoA hydratase family protein [Novosphingobium kunmingense]PKB25585.1 DSF synthase [Novosphingobium kunmingense]